MNKVNLKMLSVVTLVTLVCFSSCSLFKNTSKQKLKESSAVVIVKDSVNVEAKQVQVKDKEVKKDVETEVVETETTKKTTTKGTSTKVTVGGKDIKPNSPITITDSLGRVIILSLDSLSSALTIEVEAPEVIEEETKKEKTTKTKDKTKESEQDSTTLINKQVAITHNEKATAVKEENKKDSTTNPINIVAIFLGIGLLLAIIIIVVKKLFT